MATAMRRFLVSLGATWVRVFVLLMTAALVTSCSSEAESVAPTVELSTTTVTTLPPSTTTTTEAPTTTEDPRIAEVEAAVAAYRSELREVLSNPDRQLDRLSELAGQDLFEVVEAGVLQRRAEGRIAVGSFTLRPVETTITSEMTATHLSCGLDGIAGLSSTGETLVAADQTAFLRQYTLTRSSADDSWRVETIAFPGAEKAPCDL